MIGRETYLQQRENCCNSQHNQNGSEPIRNAEQERTHREEQKKRGPDQLEPTAHPQDITEEKKMCQGKKDEQVQWVFSTVQQERANSPEEQDKNIQQRKPEPWPKIYVLHRIPFLRYPASGRPPPYPSPAAAPQPIDPEPVQDRISSLAQSRQAGPLQREAD